jgi:hypothetical protein
VDTSPFGAVWSDVLDALLFVREQEPRQNAEQLAAAVEAISQVREREGRAAIQSSIDASGASDCSGYLPVAAVTVVLSGCFPTSRR